MLQEGTTYSTYFLNDIVNFSSNGHTYTGKMSKLKTYSPNFWYIFVNSFQQHSFEIHVCRTLPSSDLLHVSLYFIVWPRFTLFDSVTSIATKWWCFQVKGNNETAVLAKIQYLNKVLQYINILNYMLVIWGNLFSKIKFYKGSSITFNVDILPWIRKLIWQEAYTTSKAVSNFLYECTGENISCNCNWLMT